MCWKFHGKMPSHRKQEKMRQKEELESKKMQISVGLNPNLLGGLKGKINAPATKRSLGSLSTSTSGSIKKPKKI